MLTADKTILLHTEEPLLLSNEIFVKSEVFQLRFIEYHCVPGFVLRGRWRMVQILLLMEIMFWYGRDQSSQASNEN